MKNFNFKCVSLGLASFLVLTGCTTFSKSECEKMDFAQRGRNGALKGETLNETSYYYLRNCETEHQVPVDRERLKSGYVDGLRTFCTPEFTQKFARNGGVYNGTCPQSTVSTLEGRSCN